jgi:maleate isomerase
MREEGCDAPVITSAGALVNELKLAGVKSVSVVAPYMQALTDLVVGYLRHEGIQVVDSIALCIADNLEVGRRNPRDLLADAGRLNTKGVDAVVISACVQMPSLPAIPRVEQKLGLPVTSAAVCTARSMMRALNIQAVAPDAGYFLSEANLAEASLAKRAATISR